MAEGEVVKPEPEYRVEIPQASNRWITIVMLSLCLCPLLIHAVLYVKVMIHLVLVRNDAVYPEGANVYIFLWALKTGKLYANPFDFPLDVQAYGPVFYLTGVGLAKLTHGDPWLTTELSRFLSLLSLLISAGVIGYLCVKLEARPFFAAASVIVCLACAWNIPWAVSARPDSFAMVLILVAFSVYLMARGRSWSVPVFMASVLATLAVLTKQNTLVVLIAMFVDTLLSRRLREAAALAVGCLPIPALVVVALLFRHEAFLANFMALRDMPMDWSLVVSTVAVTFRMYQLAALPILVALLGIGVRWKEDRYRPILLAVVLTCLGNVAALANTGGNANYLTTPWLMMALFVPAGLVKIEEWGRRSVLVPAGMMTLSGVLLVHQWNLLQAGTAIPANLNTSRLGSVKVLSDYPYLELRSQRPQLLDPFYYHIATLQGLWSPAPIINQITAESYDLILIRGSDGDVKSAFYTVGFHGISFWGNQMLDPIMSHYRVLCEVPGAMAFVPRDRPVAIGASDIEHIFGQPCNSTVRIPQLANGER